MKTKLIASALLALTIAASGSAMAQRGNDHNDRNDRNDRGQQQHDNNGHNDGRNDDARKFKRDNSRGGGPNHDLRRGQKLNKEYRDNRYVVSDWKNRHLSAPPRGQHWVRAGNDYVLAAIATGVITQILLSN
jgi:Ni/Co efflux regulator RcnB